MLLCCNYSTAGIHVFTSYHAASSVDSLTKYFVLFCDCYCCTATFLLTSCFCLLLCSVSDRYVWYLQLQVSHLKELPWKALFSIYMLELEHVIHGQSVNLHFNMADTGIYLHCESVIFANRSRLLTVKILRSGSRPTRWSRKQRQTDRLTDRQSDWC